MTNFSQDNRYLKVESPLGGDALMLARFEGREAVSELFEYELELVSEDAAIDPTELVGQVISWSVEDVDTGSRPFSGIVRRFSAGGSDSTGFRVYRAVVVPKLWLATRRTACRIFQEQTVVEIIQTILDELGVTEVDTGGLTGSYAPLEFCVQFRESDFAFISRLMEEYGIFYFFRYAPGSHKLILADDISAYQACDPDELPLYAAQLAGHRVMTWDHDYELTSGAVSYRDYDFVKPTADLEVDHPTLLDVPPDTLELYDYPGRYVESSVGDALAKSAMEAEEARYDVARGTSTCPALAIGGTFRLAGGHGYDSESGNDRVLVWMQHSGVDTSFRQTGAGTEYKNAFACLPSGVPARATRRTPRPRVQGPQTAVVTGPSGEEIHTDEYGRIKVRFHWDRSGVTDDKSSCWIRVAQSWAGKQWGAQYIPRVGQEVVVDFLDGDPDRPLVTGSVYNNDLKPPYELPANKTQSGLKSRSTKEGGTSNYNEIRFEDKKGSEMVTIQAEKDLERLVKNDETDKVQNDRVRDVGHDETLTIGNIQAISVGKDQTEDIGNNRTLSVGKDDSISVGSNQTLSVGKDRSASVGGKETISVAKDQVVAVDGKQEVAVTKDQQVDVGEKHSLAIGKDHTMTVGGKATVTVEKDSKHEAKKITLEAQDEILLKTGSASIKLQKNGDITIKGKKITVKGSGDVVIKGSKVTAN